MSLRALWIGVCLAVVAGGCLGGSASPHALSVPPPSTRLIPLAACPVTHPNQVVPQNAAAFSAESFNLRNRWLGAVLWPHGILPVGRLPDGGSYAGVRSDGWVYAKQGWWRGIKGDLQIVGQRLDRTARALRADIPAGYGDTGFEPVALLFPSMGCWKVTANIGDKQLAYVIRLAKA